MNIELDARNKAEKATEEITKLKPALDEVQDDDL